MAKNKVKEETPNPYNKNKSWHEGEDKPFGKYAIAGAKAGREYGLKHRGDHVKLHMINNFEWLKEQFNGTV